MWMRFDELRERTGRDELRVVWDPGDAASDEWTLLPPASWRAEHRVVIARRRAARGRFPFDHVVMVLPGADDGR